MSEGSNGDSKGCSVQQFEQVTGDDVIGTKNLA